MPKFNISIIQWIAGPLFILALNWLFENWPVWNSIYFEFRFNGEASIGVQLLTSLFVAVLWWKLPRSFQATRSQA